MSVRVANSRIIERTKAGELPEELLATLDGMDNIQVSRLVEEYLSAQAQSLKILPQAPFGDAVYQFVDKNDKHAMEDFVRNSLAEQVQQMLNLGNNDRNQESDLESAMEQIKQKLEQQFKAGNLKQARRRKYKPKPDDWDSDMDGHWEDQPQAVENAPPAIETMPQKAQPKGRGRRANPFLEDDDDDDDMGDIAEEPPAPKPKGRGRPAAAAKPRAAAAKAPAKKAPARGGRGRKAQVVEEDEEEEEEEDVVMDDDDYDPPAPPPKRTTTRAAPARSQASRVTPAASQAKTTRQTRLNFSSQKNSQQQPMEISDDEISDDFESVPDTRKGRR